ncbi:MAG: hypothetical protein ACOYOS_23515 [Syntrophales bacterium]
MTASSKVVTPVKTGVQCFCKMLKFLDSGFHRNDDFRVFLTFDESINISKSTLWRKIKKLGIKCLAEDLE